ncbi:hypothetical protein AMJ80_05265 [bacterium SM23_31]|nr:MAG: hypothetical protein AMJ80_05265 [bacterium SM23_31]
MVRDSELIQDFLEGDINGFNCLARKWQVRLYSFAYRYLMDEEEAKEIVQSALIKTYKNLRKLKNPEKFSSWIFQITVNLCKDYIKNTKNNRLTALNEEIIQSESANNDHMHSMETRANPVKKLDQQNLAEIIKKTLAQLPEEQRVVIIMKEYEGFKFSEIAEFLSCPVNTVKSRMYYGLTQMQKILKKYNINGDVIFNEM